MVERLFLGQGLAKGVIGVDAVEGQCLGIQVGTFEGLDMAADGLAGPQMPVFVHVQDDGRNLQQGIGCCLESSRFHVDNHRKVATKALADQAVVSFVFHARQDTQCEAR